MPGLDPGIRFDYSKETWASVAMPAMTVPTTAVPAVTVPAVTVPIGFLDARNHFGMRDNRRGHIDRHGRSLNRLQRNPAESDSSHNGELGKLEHERLHKGLDGRQDRPAR